MRACEWEGGKYVVRFIEYCKNTHRKPNISVNLVGRYATAATVLKIHSVPVTDNFKGI